MNKFNWDSIKEFEVIGGLYGKFIHTPQMTFVRWRFDAGAVLPMHDHPHEQVTLIESGKLELTVGEIKNILQPGDVVPIESNLPHGGKAIEETIAIDVFSPVREDFKEKYG